MKSNVRILFYLFLCVLLTVGGIFAARRPSDDHASDTTTTAPTVDLSLTPLGTPTSLIWNQYPQTCFDDEKGDYQVLETSYGTVCWMPGEFLDPSGTTTYELCLYKDGELVYSDACSYYNEDLTVPEYQSSHLAYELEFDSGEYFFTLQATTDTEGYRDSEAAVSDTWNYEKPEVQFDQPKNIIWNDGEITWEADSVIAENHQIEYYYAATAAEEPSFFMSSWCPPCSSDETDAWYLENPGYYYVRVRVLSPDIAQYQNSPWSELSKPHHVSEGS